MNFNEIAKIVCFFSFLGMLAIILRKAPVLVSLPAIEEKKEKKNWIFLIKEKIKKINPFKKISYENILQRLIYRVRILSLKTDNKTFQLLQDLKKKALEKKRRLDDNYWAEIKKMMKK